MSKKIILFLSELRDNSREKEYACPDGSRKVAGTQTNEAPVKYLLRAHPDISEIICIVTPTSLDTAWEKFREEIAAEKQDVEIKQVPFVDGQNFTRGPLAQIMADVTAGDEILLETTGGPRNAVMHLLLLSRVLSYAGVRTIGAVYSNFNEEQIEDVSNIVGLFELVGGMQELTSFGSVRTLRRYYAVQPKDERIEELLTAMERLTESIALCRTAQIDERMERFDAALNAAGGCSDPMMRALLPAFRQKFGKKLTIPGLIKWCVESDMFQQALTIYRERIPRYIMVDRSDLFKIKPNAPEPDKEKVPKNENKDVAYFNEHFLRMGEHKARYGGATRIPDDWMRDVYVRSIENMERYLPGSYCVVKCSVSQLQQIAMDYLYIRALRNMTNHANEQTAGSQKVLIGYLAYYGYKEPSQVSAADMRKILLDAVEHLKSQKKKEQKL